MVASTDLKYWNLKVFVEEKVSHLQVSKTSFENDIVKYSPPRESDFKFEL